MHPAFLNHYFDREKFHHDLFMALLRLKSEWTWGDLSDAFLVVAIELGAPMGSASLRVEWINHLKLSSRVRFTPVGSDSSQWKIEAGLLPPKKYLSLQRAAKWALKKRDIRDREHGLRTELFAQLENLAYTGADARLLLQKIHASRTAEKRQLSALNNKFRLAP